MKHPFRTAALSAAVIATLGLSSAAVAGGRPDLVLAGLKAGKAHQAGELLVKFRDGSTAAQQTAVRQGLGAEKLDVVRQGNGKKGELALMRLPAGKDIAATVSALAANPNVEYAEPNWTYQHHATSNDSYYSNGSLWGMYGDASSPANQYGSQAAEAWAAGHTSCNGVVVGVIDEGIFYNHEDLAANIWTNPYDPADGIDNDGNGYVDDVRGWDFEGNTNNINSGGASDDHGTHVSGTIAGIGGNGKGVAGVCWSGVKLISGKFLGRRGGSTANAIKAIDYFNDLKARHGLNIVATNNSWGGGGFSQALQDAIGRADSAGILFIAAAGNDAYNNDTTASYPSNYPNANVIAVASTTSTGGLSSFSQWGPTTVDIGAPGSGIYSTVPVSSKGKLVSGYASYNGTSMATPHVTGAAALYASSHPGATAADIKAAILGSAVPTASLSGKVLTGGRLNVSGF
ncbi:S8 family serine peptidase [Lysobacter solisilvae (ex Woo and Kim 2022)]|uniref:S8 family serine peptidase n=1 Tax=Agrilutibacter terrestris TaxID=2865112 RepID=A0A7H0FWD8_9GAMM|nr:S8 family serine peptidase [Lysobacter terrestris]QNP40354.1 S8 family serine peptidase [Lysobacter terrestris]